MTAVEEDSDVSGKHVCNGVFLHETKENEEQRTTEFLAVRLVLSVKLGLQRIEAPDGSLNELWEPGDEEKESGITLFRRIFVVVHINEITDGLKGVERNPERKDKTQACIEKCFPILEIAEDTEIYGETDDQENTLPTLHNLFCLLPVSAGSLAKGAIFESGFFDSESAEPDGERGHEDIDDVNSADHKIEDQRCREQADPLVLLKDRIIREHHYREEYYECERIEFHVKRLHFRGVIIDRLL